MTIVDSFANMLSGLGLGNPKTAANGYAMAGALTASPAEVEAAYRGSTWFGRIVDDRVDDSISKWRTWQADKAQIELIENAETALGVIDAVRQAMIWGRLYGGGAIYLGGLPGLPHEPLDLARVGKGTLKYLAVYTRYDLTAGEMDRDPGSTTVGRPRYYDVAGTRIHPSRLVVFRGRKVGGLGMDDGWGDSIWTHMRDAVTNADSAPAVVAALLQEAKSDIVRVDGMMANMATDNYSRLMTERFRMAQVLKSVTGVTLLDKSDEWDTRQITWSGIPDVVESLLTIMCGAAGYPVVRLLGTSAKGLNATGEGDLRNYYDQIVNEQRIKVSPALRQLDEALIRSALGTRPPDVWYAWNPLWAPSEKEQAETNKINADADTAYVASGLVSEQALAEAVTSRMINSGLYPGLDDAIAKYPRGDEPAELTAAADAAPRSLYVRRDVLNAAEILTWAEGQGIKDLQSADDLHVTVLYSRTPVDWLAMGNDWRSEEAGGLVVPAGGPRVVERLGPKQVVVLSFANTDLSYRHRSMIERGASSEYDEYVAHVTLSQESQALLDLDKLAPYRGKIILGPEIFEQVKD